MSELEPTEPEHVERALIEDFFDGALDREHWRELMEHLQTCTACRKYYAQLQTMYRIVDGHDIDDLGLSRREADRWPTQSAPPTRRTKWLAPAAAALLTAAAVFLMMRPRNELTPKAAGDTLLSLDVLCIASGDRPSTSSAYANGGACAAGVVLKPRVLVVADSLQIAVVALDEHWQVQLRSRAAPRSGERTALKGHAALAAGQGLTFIALASRNELSDAAIDAALASARKEHATLSGQTRLVIDDVLAQAVMQVHAP